MDFIIDRTAEDVMYAQSLQTAIWSKMENEQKAEWLKGLSTPLESLKGFFNYTDMNRIKDNYNSLRTTYSYSGDAISNSYAMSTIPNLTTMSADFEKIRLMGSAYLPYFYNASFIDYRTPNALSSSVNRIDYNFLNNYEHILKNLYDYNNDGELMLECEYNYNADDIELDGIMIGRNSHEISFTIPSGYLCTYAKGHFVSSDYVKGADVSFATDGEEFTLPLGEEDYGFQFKVESGMTSDDVVMSFGVSGNTVDTTHYDTVDLSCDMLQYETTVNYEASSLQSDMVDVTDKASLYVYNISDYSGNIIITTYDENQDAIDEFALTENMQIDLTNVGYFTIDSEVGDTLTYLLASGTLTNNFSVRVGNTGYQYPTVTSFDVSDVNSITITKVSLNNYKFVVNIQKSINGGKDISQLDTNDIEVKYS